MKLNPKEPYGHIYGNHAASYTQHGKYFDSAGNEVTTDGEEVHSDAEGGVEAAAEYLRGLLFDTRMTPKAIEKQAEIDGYALDDIRDAAVQIDVRKFKSGPHTYWALPEDEEAE
jgi:hypothetical protein